MLNFFLTTFKALKTSCKIFVFQHFLVHFKVHPYVNNEIGKFLLEESMYKFYFETGFISDGQIMMKKLTKLVHDSNICFDIGANTGVTTVWLARHARFVHAFEPEAKNLKELNLHLALNQIKNVKINKSAVSDFSGSATFHVLEGYGHHSLGDLKTSKKIKSIKVPTITVNQYCKQNEIRFIDVLKIDVEGFEYEVLMGCSALLKEQKIKIIIFEVSDVILRQLKKNKVLLFDLLFDHGYCIFSIDGKKLSRSDFQKIIQDDVYALPLKV